MVPLQILTLSSGVSALKIINDSPITEKSDRPFFYGKKKEGAGKNHRGVRRSDYVSPLAPNQLLRAYSATGEKLGYSSL